MGAEQSLNHRPSSKRALIIAARPLDVKLGTLLLSGVPGITLEESAELRPGLATVRRGGIGVVLLFARDMPHAARAVSYMQDDSPHTAIIAVAAPAEQAALVKAGVYAVFDTNELSRAELQRTVTSAVSATEERAQKTMGTSRARRTAERGFQAVAEISYDAMITMDGAGIILHANPVTGRIFRCNPKDVVGKPFWELLAKKHRNRLRASLTNFGAHPESGLLDYNLEAAGELQDGGGAVMLKITLATWMVFEEARVTAVLRDLSETIALESAREASDERFRRLYESLPIAVYRTTVDGNIIEANPATAHMFGLNSVAELTTSGAKSRYRDPEARTRHVEAMKAAKGEWVSAVHEFQQIDGSRVWARGVARIITDETGEKVIEGTLEDVTKEVIAKSSAEEKDRRMEDALDAVSDVVYTHDMSGVIEYVNPAAERVFGYGRSELIGMNLAELVEPTDLPRVRREIAAKASDPSAKSKPYDVRCRTKDGSVVELTITSWSVALFDQTVGVQGVARVNSG